jgi:hypothetical protein
MMMLAIGSFALVFLPMLCYKVTDRLGLQKSTSFVATLLQPCLLTGD